MVTPLGLALVVSAHGERCVLHARTVVLSGGSGCALARNLRLDGAPVLTAAVSASLRAKAMPEFPSFLYEPDVPGGYAWIFPLDDGRANVGVCALTPGACQGLKQRTVDFAAKCGTVAAGLHGGVEALWSGRGRVWHHAHGSFAAAMREGLSTRCGEKALPLPLSPDVRQARRSLPICAGTTKRCRTTASGCRSISPPAMARHPNAGPLLHLLESGRPRVDGIRTT